MADPHKPKFRIVTYRSGEIQLFVRSGGMMFLAEDLSVEDTLALISELQEAVETIRNQGEYPKLPPVEE